MSSGKMERNRSASPAGSKNTERVSRSAAPVRREAAGPGLPNRGRAAAASRPSPLGAGPGGVLSIGIGLFGCANRVFVAGELRIAPGRFGYGFPVVKDRLGGLVGVEVAGQE